MNINAITKLASLIGHPVSHSLSPDIHSFISEKYNNNLAYLCFDVETENIGKALEGLKAINFIGTNVTIPHKINVMEYLDEIDPNAKIIGAVNTVKNDNGKLIGYNTDGVGFCNSVLDAGFEIKGKKIMVLGAGGASRGVAVTLADYGASEIIIRNKTLSRAEIIANDINEHFPSCKASIGDMNITKEDIDAVNILINTTPLGMSKDKDKCAIDTNIVPDNKNLVVCDIVFNPHETKLLKWAKDNGLGVVYGIGMLIGQAIESYRIWTGIDIKESTANEIYESLKSNGRL